jgi:hypothetical protein
MAAENALIAAETPSYSVERGGDLRMEICAAACQPPTLWIYELCAVDPTFGLSAVPHLHPR